MLAWQNANRTVVRRLERGDLRAKELAKMLPFPPSRKQWRQLRRSRLIFAPTPRQKRRAIRKHGDPDTAQRIAAFLGHRAAYGSGDGRYAIRLPGGAELAITDEANERLRKEAAKELRKKRAAA